MARHPPRSGPHVNNSGSLLRAARYVWASPCSAVGLAFALLLCVFGGRARVQCGVLEVSASQVVREGRLPFGAITFGHVVLGRNEQVLNQFRAHELEHVKQYELWGLFFFLAYPVSSVVQLLKGRNPYWFNYFEVQARERSAKPQQTDDSLQVSVADELRPQSGLHVPWRTALVNVKRLFPGCLPYLSWALVSAVWLAVAQHIDPYLFGFSAFGAAFMSGLVVFGALILDWRHLHWAVLSAVPTVLAFMLLSTYKWA